MKEEILLSFIIPMYNAEKYIGNCIDSILVQNIEENRFEIIVIDDGSIDDGKSIVLKYNNIIYYRQDNQGQSAARNKGIELAKGKYILFVDADDVLIENTIKFCLNTAIDNNLDMVTYDILRCKEEYLNKTTAIITNKVDEPLTGIGYLEKYNVNNGPWWYLIKKSALGNIKFVQGRYGEDGMFTVELFIHIKKVAHINNQCYLYIERPNSTTTKQDLNHSKKMIEDYLFVYHYIQNLIKDNQNILSTKAIAKCNKRSESYIFFLLVRLLKTTNSDLIKPYIERLKQEGLYPIKQPYPGMVYDFTSFVVNHYPLLKICNWILCKTYLKGK